MEEPRLILGGLAVDDRGIVRFCNDFDFEGVKRFYVLENHAVGFVRAWHGHLHEAKYVTVVSGTAIIGVVKMGEIAQPRRFIMSALRPAVLYIPPMYYNGSMALTENTKIVHFSTMSLGESKGDDVRLPPGAYAMSVWEVEQR